jgi:hypothetical protein
MKTRTNNYGIWSGLLLGTALAASAIPITFQINMGAQKSLGTFDPATDTVFVAGDPINGWNTSASQLEPSASDSDLYTGTFDVPGAVGATVSYKYIKNTFNNGVIWEGNVGPNGAQNRSFSLPASNLTLPVVYFNNVSNAVAVTQPVTFQVDMGVQTGLGAFDPASGTVVVAGAFNNWSTVTLPLAPSETDSNIWVGTFPITDTAGVREGYRFVMNGSTWESLSADRSFVFTNAPLTLPVAFFSNVSDAVVYTNAITLQLDMAVQIAQGNFDPASGTVAVAGDLINNWGAAMPLTQNAANTNTWTGIFSLQGTSQSISTYKFVMNGTYEANNRQFVLGTSNQTLAVAYFNGTNNLGSLSFGPIAAGQTALSWSGGPLIRLQSSTNLGVWLDVPNSLGQSSAAVPVGPGQSFFRLTGP